MEAVQQILNVEKAITATGLTPGSDEHTAAVQSALTETGNVVAAEITANGPDPDGNAARAQAAAQAASLAAPAIMWFANWLRSKFSKKTAAS
jgi:hypothetical protein